ncbi:MAG: RecQ family ATP-dependent DNA helicase [Cyanobacteria bacterium REEB459]|nr:RecQ family ATP-dependent DNA helicase [Cyanobacteria bacterium REEB459]
MTPPTWDQVLKSFQQIWGYADFRQPQGEIVKALIDRQDLLVVLPTGGGKSICFQLPAVLQSGLTLVVSPLLALIENQVQELRQKNLPAAALHSEMARQQRQQILQALDQRQLRLLYLSPETLLSPPVWQRLSDPNLEINGLILDEAHCLVQWGDSFRPAYQRLGAVRQTLAAARPDRKIPLAAFTATADPQAQQVLCRVLQLQSPRCIRVNPHRSNLHLGVKRVVSLGHRQFLMDRYLRHHPHESGLIYVRTRRDSETLAARLVAQNYRTAPYHGGLGGADRRRIEASWMENRLQFVVCTSAFGLGINKPSTRWVFHYQAPHILTEYVQEVGRAGRDGHWAEALTLVSEPTGWIDPSDRQRARFFRDQTLAQQQKAQQLVSQIPARGTVEQISQKFKEGAIALSWLHRSGQLDWLDPFHYQLRSPPPPVTNADTDASHQLHQFFHSPSCRWRSLLVAFGFPTEAQTLGDCGHCDNCCRSRRHTGVQSPVQP